MADETRTKLQELIKEQGEVVRKLKAAKADGAKGVDLKSQLSKINAGLGNSSYIGGWLPTKLDKKLFDIFINSLNSEIDNYPHIRRWFNNIKSYELEERERFVDNGISGQLEAIVEGLGCKSPIDWDKKVRR